MAAIVLGICAFSGCVHQTSDHEQRKIELLALNLAETENVLVICDQFPDGTRYPIPDSIAVALREVLMRARPATGGLPENFRGTISPTDTLSWIQLGELEWYFVPQAEPYGFCLENEAQIQFRKLIVRILRYNNAYKDKQADSSNGGDEWKEHKAPD